jgi:hypothetical protein
MERSMMPNIAMQRIAISAFGATCLCLAAATPALAQKERDDLIAACQVDLVTPTTDCACVADTMMTVFEPHVRTYFVELMTKMGEDSEAASEMFSAHEGLTDEEFDALGRFMNVRVREECNRD